MLKALIPALTCLLTTASVLNGSPASAQASQYAVAVNSAGNAPEAVAIPSDAPPDGGCDIKSGSCTFAQGSAQPSEDVKRQLSALAADMRAYPNCRMVIQGHGGGGKVDQQLSWDHVSNSIGYLADVENIDRNRFIFQYGAEGDVTLIDYRVAGENEQGSSTLPRPQH